MARILDLIRDWATQLEYWEQAALEKVASGTALTETDYEGLLDLCMQDAETWTPITHPHHREMWTPITHHAGH